MADSSVMGKTMFGGTVLLEIYVDDILLIENGEVSILVHKAYPRQHFVTQVCRFHAISLSLSLISI